jgi:hypothetical protein
MRYKATLDNRAIIITSAVTILFCFIIGGQYAFIKDGGRADPIYTTVLCLAIYLVAFAFRPIDYLITTDELIIHRPLLNVHIKRADIKSVELIDRQKIVGSFRIFGSGGLFGYYGVFKSFPLGSMTWYATSRRHPILIKTTDGRRIVISPDNAPDVVDEFST